MKIVPYESASAEEIQHLFAQTFADSAGEAEGKIIGELVLDIMTTTDAEDLYGFLALDEGKTVGGIFWTRLTFENDIDAFLLSPVAVRSDFQGKGVGQELIRFGIEHLKNDGVNLVFTYGDPKFYSKVGFQSITEETIKAPYPLSQPIGWLAQSLVSEEVLTIPGDSRCVEAFQNSELW